MYPQSPALHIDAPRWFIWYTKPRAEKKVLERLRAKNIEVFLPIQRTLRQWSDRKKWVDVPLFGGYIFTCISQKEWDITAFTEGILTYVRSEGRPAWLRPEQIKDIRVVLGERIEVAENTELTAGEPVEVTFGPLCGLRGEVVTFRGQQKLAIHIDQMGKIVLVHLPAHYVKSLSRGLAA